MLLPIPGRRVRRQLQHRAIDQALTEKRPVAKQKTRNQVTRKKVLLATTTIKHPSLTPTQIDAGARVCYESFARDVGYANRARFVVYDKLKGRHQQTIATNKRSTSAAARRPPTAAQSAAQARRAARAPRRSIRMPIALHGLALGKASDAISPLNAVVEPGCCRTPPAAAASSAFAATARAPAFAPNRISLKRNRRRRPAGGASGSL